MVDKDMGRFRTFCHTMDRNRPSLPSVTY